MKSRREFLKYSGLLGAGVFAASCAPSQYVKKGNAAKFPKLDISVDRVIKETVGLRPYRKNGFRLEKEVLGSKTLIHNYGHGGSGWSLSWGTANLAAGLVSEAPPIDNKIAVMGCGVIGITTSRLLQLKGYDVTIYAKELPPKVTSSKATGTWSPSYRLIDEQLLTPAFAETWKKAALFSFGTYQNLLGLGDIVTWIDDYIVRENITAPTPGHSSRLEIPGLLPERKILTHKEHPFQVDSVIKQTNLIFNIPSYLNKHINDFLAFGGKVIIKDFKSLEDVDSLPEKCVVNCTGLGSKALFNDENLNPIAGQLSFLIPQPNFNYRLTTENGYAIPRKDGIVLGGNALEGSWDETPNAEQTEKVVTALMKVMNSMRA